jgi:hypothetical protein
MKDRKFYGVWFVRSSTSEKCIACGTATTRLIRVGDMTICCECAVHVMSNINNAINRHAAEAAEEFARKEMRDASVGSNL